MARERSEAQGKHRAGDACGGTQARLMDHAGVRTKVRMPVPQASGPPHADFRPHSGKPSTSRLTPLPTKKSGETRSADTRPPTPQHPIHPLRGYPNTQHPTPLPELDRGPSERRLVALTFDAGSSPAPTPGILRALKAADRRCTFFLTGEWTAQNPQLVRRIAAEGHELGNHTYTHPDLRHVSNARVARELERTDALVREVAGRGTQPYFRPPFGARDGRVLREAARHGYRCVYWTTDSLDSVKQGITPRQIERRVLARVQPGSIILMHCGSEATAEALPHLLTALHKRGYRVVTVSDLLRARQASGLTQRREEPKNSVPEGRPRIAQRFIAGNQTGQITQSRRDD